MSFYEKTTAFFFCGVRKVRRCFQQCEVPLQFEGILIKHYNHLIAPGYFMWRTSLLVLLSITCLETDFLGDIETEIARQYVSHMDRGAW